MTPHTLRLKILAARQQSIRELRSAIDSPELLAVLDEDAAAVQSTILKVQRERETAGTLS